MYEERAKERLKKSVPLQMNAHSHTRDAVQRYIERQQPPPKYCYTDANTHMHTQANTNT